MTSFLPFEIDIQNVKEKSYNCYIPIIDTYFFVTDFNDINKVAIAMMESYIKFNLKNNE